MGVEWNNGTERNTCGYQLCHQCIHQGSSFHAHCIHNCILDDRRNYRGWPFCNLLKSWKLHHHYRLGRKSSLSTSFGFNSNLVEQFATLFTILSALASTIIFSTLTAALNGSLKEYNIVTHLGTKMLAIDWLAAAFSIAASLFWFISICCCSGRSNRKERRSAAAPATGSGFAPFGNRGYQPIADDGVQHPSMYGQQPGNRGMEMQDFGAGPYKGRDTAYEPFRHGGV
jgi:SUR7/PalI family